MRADPPDNSALPVTSGPLFCDSAAVLCRPPSSPAHATPTADAWPAASPAGPGARRCGLPPSAAQRWGLASLAAPAPVRTGVWDVAGQAPARRPWDAGGLWRVWGAVLHTAGVRRERASALTPRTHLLSKAGIFCGRRWGGYGGGMGGGGGHGGNCGGNGGDLGGNGGGMGGGGGGWGELWEEWRVLGGNGGGGWEENRMKCPSFCPEVEDPPHTWGGRERPPQY